MATKTSKKPNLVGIKYGVTKSILEYRLHPVVILLVDMEIFGKNWIDVRSQYYHLTEPERNQYRLQLISKQNSSANLCPDVIKEISSYL